MSTLKTNAIRHISATSDAITLASDGTATAKITNRSNPNILINGQFDIWQRATDSGSVTTTGYTGADRWRINASGATYQFSRQAFTEGQTDVPSYPKYYARLAVTTGANNCYIGQRIEDVRSVQGEVTLSFWCKGTNPGGGHLDIDTRQEFGSGGSTDVQTVIDSLTLTGSWVKKTVTFTPGSLSGKTVGASSDADDTYFQIDIKQPNDDNTTSAWTLDIANIQLEVGNSASDYNVISYGDELARCQRYYQTIVKGNGSNLQVFNIGDWYATSQLNINVPLKVTMRAKPSIHQSEASNWCGWYGNGASGNISPAWTEWNSPDSGNMLGAYLDPDTDGTAGTAARVYLSNTDSGKFLAVTAEL